MKILEIQGQVEGGGSERHTLLLARGLRDRGHDVVLAIPDTDHPMVAEMEALGIPLERFRMVPTWLRLFDVPRGLWVRRLIRRYDIDVVHTHIFNADAMGWLGARLTGRPVVTTLHGPSINVHMSRTLVVRVFLACITWLLERFDRRIAISPFVQRYVSDDRGIPIEDIDVVFNASDVASHAVDVDEAALRVSLGIPSGVPIVSAIGVLNDQKRPMSFVEAAGRIATERPDCHFLLIGKGPLEAAIRYRVEALGIGSVFHVLGHRSDVPALLAITSILAFTPRDEGFGRVMTEAMSSAVPVVAFRSGASPDIVVDGETGHLVADGDVEALAGRCLELLGDEPTRARMAVAARARARALFDVGPFVERTEAILGEVVTAHRRRDCPTAGGLG